VIELRKGDLFESGCQALVNPVNCVGVMGGGLALEFKTRFPQMFVEYKLACRDGNLRPGTLHVWKDGGPYVINFPTKDDWRNPSKMEYVCEGLEALDAVLRDRDIRSVAIPALGCGLGGLPWDEVRKAVTEFADRKWHDRLVALYEPK
jgi:O-acetyl-ADP-ribose deacetylase (regulator of RNase III)